MQTIDIYKGGGSFPLPDKFFLPFPESPCSSSAFLGSFSLHHQPSNLSLSAPSSSGFSPSLLLAGSAGGNYGPIMCRDGHKLVHKWKSVMNFSQLKVCEVKFMADQLVCPFHDLSSCLWRFLSGGISRQTVSIQPKGLPNLKAITLRASRGASEQDLSILCTFSSVTSSFHPTWMKSAGIVSFTSRDP